VKVNSGVQRHAGWDFFSIGMIRKMRIAIIGGGIAGLAAAFELEKARATGAEIEYALFEGRDRLGGSLASEIVEGAVLERGPDSFLTEKPAAAELCRELGLGDELVPSNDAARKTYVVIGNRLVALPDGLMFLVPTKLLPTALSPLFSLSTKARMAMELLHPPRVERDAQGDESVAALVERHYGAEAVDRLADPLLAGIYGGDAAQLSARTVLPRLVEMESKYGSLTRGMLAAHRKMRQSAVANGQAQAGSQPPQRALFTALRGGMQQLVDAITARLDAGAVHLSAPVRSVEKDADGWRVDAGGFVRIYDAVVVASPAWAAGELLRSVDSELAAELEAIPYSSSITVNLVYDESRLGPLPEGFGFLVPPSENRAMLACTFVHRKFLGRTPPGKAVFRAFLGGMKNEELLGEPDAALIAVVRRELREILGERVFGQTGEPDHAQVSRWRRAMAQYAVGHKQRMEHIEARLAGLPNVHLVGNAYDGIGVPDCIRLGRQAARELVGLAVRIRAAGAQLSPAAANPGVELPLPRVQRENEGIRAPAVK
jgi:oxygen-dependent protoporphyrinogen oxidase